MAKMILDIYDVSYLVHTGTASAFKANSIMGVQCGGISHLMDKVFLHISQGHSVALAFDSHNDRKEMCNTFKANRVPNPEIYMQCELLKQWCKQMGIPAYYKDGYEADEVIYNLVKQNYIIYNEVNIYSGDSDVACNLIDNRFTMIGTSTTSPTFNAETYPFSIKKGAIIQYNSILPYILFMGKPSNNMEPVRMRKGKPIDLYENYLSFCNAQEIPEYDRSNEKWIQVWLLMAKRSLDSDVVQQIKDRVPLVYPREIPAEEVQVPLSPYNTIKKDEVAKFLRLFGLKYSAINMDLRDKVDFRSDLSQSEKQYFLNLRSQIDSGVFAVDADLPLNGAGPVSDFTEFNFDDVDLVDKPTDSNPFVTGLFSASQGDAV